MSLRGRWIMRWQNYPQKFLQALRDASERPTTVIFATSREAQSFKVRMQKLGRGILADETAPDWLRKAAEDVAWSIVRQTPEGYTVTGDVRKERYIPLDRLVNQL